MAKRYTDLDISISGARDFVIRKRAPTILHLLVIFSIAYAVAFVLATYITDRMALMGVLFLILGGISWYMIVQIQRSRDLVLTTEFQNALFASALGINNKFCLIIKRDGNITYIDRSFQEMFPDYVKQARRSIDTLLEYGRVAREDREKIFGAIERGVYDKVIFDIRGADNKFSKIVMSIEPILRPSGFILLRAREFVEQRSTSTSADANKMTAGSLLSKSSITLFSYVMDTMHMGVYMTGPAGDVIYVNPVLEQWLAYSEGEITSRNLSIQDLIYQSIQRSNFVEPMNYEGEVVFQKKVGGTVKAYISQKIIHDDFGKVLGCTAMVQSMMEQADTESKKKLW